MIGITNLSFSYPNKCVFEKVSLSLPDAPAIALMGPSGCGKTTLLRLISGLLTPERGEITGVPERISMVFQEDRLLPWRTARGNAALALKKGESTEPVLGILSELGLSDSLNLFPSELSGGMKRRVAIARALSVSPALLIMDEPFQGLDEELRESVARVCADHACRILFSTHDPKEAELLSAATIRFPLT